MNTIDWPDDIVYVPERFEIGVRGPASVATSPTVGALYVTPTAAPRFVAVLGFNGQTSAAQAQREALFARIAGQTNFVTMWHLLRREPRGTLRGTPTLAASLGQGATQAIITCTSGATLKAGDLIKIGTQTVIVAADAAAVSTSITVDFCNPLRAAVSSGTAVEWDKPRIKWLLDTPEVYVPYQQGGLGDRFSVAFVEVW